LTDLKIDNFGRYDGLVRVRDYGLHLAVSEVAKLKMKRVSWSKG
jgi:hypothetical protein